MVSITVSCTVHIRKLVLELIKNYDVIRREHSTSFRLIRTCYAIHNHRSIEIQ